MLDPIFWNFNNQKSLLSRFLISKTCHLKRHTRETRKGHTKLLVQHRRCKSKRLVGYNRKQSHFLLTSSTTGRAGLFKLWHMTSSFMTISTTLVQSVFLYSRSAECIRQENEAGRRGAFQEQVQKRMFDEGGIKLTKCTKQRSRYWRSHWELGRVKGSTTRRTKKQKKSFLNNPNKRAPLSNFKQAGCINGSKSTLLYCYLHQRKVASTHFYHNGCARHSQTSANWDELFV